jgi:Na+/melibiose symporter-like transporter
MWFGLVYFYLDSYLRLGGQIALMFLVGYAVGALFTPWCLKLIHRTSKSTAWAVGIGLFVAQMAGMAFLTPQSPVWIPFLLIVIVNIYFCCNDTAALSIIADIVDYGKLKFKKDRGATYFAINILIFKFGLGIGGGIALAVVGLFGFNPAVATQSDMAVMGLKLTFTVLPAFFAMIGLILVLRTPIDRRRHGIIQRRIESQQLRQSSAR